jgi:hypothetical protein
MSITDILITPAAGSILHTASGAPSAITLSWDNSTGGLVWDGSAGNLFSIEDSLTGSLMSVSDISGLPILEVFDTDRIIMGTFGNNTLVVDGSMVAINQSTATEALDVSGNIILKNINDKLLLPNSGIVPSNPTLSFGGSTGFYSNNGSAIAFAVSGIAEMHLDATRFYGNNTNGPLIYHSNGVSTTVPTYSFFGDEDTGINRGAADELSLIAGASEGMRVSNSVVNIIHDTLIGSATETPLGQLHIFDSDTGTASVTPWANSLVIEKAGSHAGLSILTDNDKIGRIAFGDAEDNDIGRVSYHHTTNEMSFTTNTIVAVTIDSSQNVILDSSLLLSEVPATGTSDDVLIRNTTTGVIEVRTTASLGSEHNLGDHIDVSTATVATGSLMYFDGVNWIDTASAMTYDGNLTIDGSIDLTATSTNQLALPDGTAAAPSLNWGTNTGLYYNGSTSIYLTVAGVNKYYFNAATIESTTSTHWKLRRAAATAISPVYVINKSSDNTGIGGIGGEISLITGGIQAVNIDASQNVTLDVSTAQLILPLQDNATFPTLAFGDGDTGLYEDDDDRLNITIGGTKTWGINTSIFSYTTYGPNVRSTGIGSTDPAFAFNGDADTGIGRATANELSLITGGVEAVNINATQDVSVAADIFLSSGNLTRGTHNSGHLEGSWNNIEGNGSKTNPIYTIGSAYNPLETTLDAMMGIGFSEESASFINGTDLGFSPPTGSTWGLYVASDGNARIWLDSTNGHGYFKGNIYAEEGHFRGDVSIGGTIDIAGDVSIGGDLYVDGSINGIYLNSGSNTDVDPTQETVATISSTLYNSVYFDFTIQDASISNLRVGTIMAVWDVSSNLNYVELAATSIGDTDEVELSVDVSNGNTRLLANVDSIDWTIKTMIRAI